MTYKELLEQIKVFEGFREQAYLCSAGVATIGYGRTKCVKLGDKTTREKEESWLDEYTSNALKYVKLYSENHNYTWNNNQLYALTSFIYNLGYKSLDQVTGNATRTNDQIGKKMLEYNKAGGKVLQGLVKRRKWESDLFLTAVNESTVVKAKMVIKHINGKYYEFTGEVKDNIAYFRVLNSSNTMGIREEEVLDKINKIAFTRV